MTDTPVVKPKPTAAQKVEGAATLVKQILVEIATLQKPVTAAAVAAFALALIPSVGLTVTEATSILVGIGVVDAALEKVV